MGDARVTADVAQGAWIVRVRGPLDATTVVRLTFTLSRLLLLGNRELVVDLREATGSIDDLLAQTAARAAAAGIGFATIEPGDADDRAALARAHASSRLRHGRTALTPDEVRIAA